MQIMQSLGLHFNILCVKLHNKQSGANVWL